MTAFGNFAQINQNTGDDQASSQSSDATATSKNLGGLSAFNASLIEQAWSFSPANYQKQSNTGDLPATLSASGYGSGARARVERSTDQDYAASTNYQIGLTTNSSIRHPGSLEATAAQPVVSPSIAPMSPLAPMITEGKTLRSILPKSGFNRNNSTSQAGLDSPAEAPLEHARNQLLEALTPAAAISAVATPDAVLQAIFVPAGPSHVAPSSEVLAAAIPTENSYFQIPAKADLEQTAPRPIVAAQPMPSSLLAKPAVISPALTPTEIPVKAPVEVASAPVSARGNFDVKAHPLFANLAKQVKEPAANFNARMDRPAAMDDLSRQVMPADFRLNHNASREAAAAVVAAGNNNDPFAADNCYQSMEISPAGVVKTTTTLPDLSASKIETRNPDRSSSLALTDHLGRPTVEQRFDSNNHLVAQTNSRFDHVDAPMVTSHKIVKTATQTIETTLDKGGTVVASKVMPYSDLSTTKAFS